MSKVWTLVSVLGVSVSAMWIGCGDETGDGGSGTGGSGTTTGATTASSTKATTGVSVTAATVTATTGVTTGGPGCDAPGVPPSDGDCIMLSGGVGGGGGAGGGAGDPIECNPVTNEPCAAGEACDVAGGGFVCYPDGNIGALCEACDPDAGEFCQGGLFCDTDICVKYCCSDADCGTGVCTMDAINGVGLCLVN